MRNSLIAKGWGFEEEIKAFRECEKDYWGTLDQSKNGDY
jgi:hypothetical protein